MAHIPVLQKEVIEYLDPKPDENFIDCTINGGGHSLQILEKTSPNGKILGIDMDSKVLGNLKEKIQGTKFKNRLILVNDNYISIEKIARENKFKNISGVLMDVGFSSWHVDESKRGFTFMKNEPLDMRYDLKNQLTAEKILNFWSEPDIERILREFGEENFSRQISKEIINARRIRPIRSTLQLVEILKRALPARQRAGKINFSTKTFQALRIAVNDELENLEKTLPKTLEILKLGGRLAVISFHSLEDRIVKNFLKNKFIDGQLDILTEKPIEPSREEIIINPRSRSAKMRVAQKR